jgi:predicted transcriptional regulator
LKSLETHRKSWLKFALSRRLKDILGDIFFWSCFLLVQLSRDSMISDVIWASYFSTIATYRVRLFVDILNKYCCCLPFAFSYSRPGKTSKRRVIFPYSNSVGLR